jgi:hypothetical protein
MRKIVKRWVSSDCLGLEHQIHAEINFILDCLFVLCKENEARFLVLSRHVETCLGPLQMLGEFARSLTKGSAEYSRFGKARYAGVLTFQETAKSCSEISPLSARPLQHREESERICWRMIEVKGLT